MLGDHLQVAAEALPADLGDGRRGGTARPTGDHQHRGEALLQADAAMGIGGAAACVGAGGAVGGGELLAGVPAPGGGGQAIGAEQPAGVGDDLHRAPTGIKKLLDAESQPLNLWLDHPGEVVLQVMSTMIEVADLQPAACLGSRGNVQLVIAQNRVALGGERLAQLGGTGGFAGSMS